MIAAIYSTRPWDETYLSLANTHHDFRFLEAKLDHTTTALAAGADAVCVFVNDLVDREVIEDLAGLAADGVRAFLIGESLMRQADVTQATRTLLADPVAA